MTTLLIMWKFQFGGFGWMEALHWRDIWVFGRGLSPCIHSCGVVKLIRLSTLHNLDFLIENLHIV